MLILNVLLKEKLLNELKIGISNYSIFKFHSKNCISIALDEI